MPLSHPPHRPEGAESLSSGSEGIFLVFILAAGVQGRQGAVGSVTLSMCRTASSPLPRAPFPCPPLLCVRRAQPRGPLHPCTPGEAIPAAGTGPLSQQAGLLLAHLSQPRAHLEKEGRAEGQPRGGVWPRSSAGSRGGRTLEAQRSGEASGRQQVEAKDTRCSKSRSSCAGLASGSVWVRLSRSLRRGERGYSGNRAVPHPRGFWAGGMHAWTAPFCILNILDEF